MPSSCIRSDSVMRLTVESDVVEPPSLAGLLFLPPPITPPASAAAITTSTSTTAPITHRRRLRLAAEPASSARSQVAVVLAVFVVPALIASPSRLVPRQVVRRAMVTLLSGSPSWSRTLISSLTCTGRTGTRTTTTAHGQTHGAFSDPSCRHQVHAGMDLGHDLPVHAYQSRAGDGYPARSVVGRQPKESLRSPQPAGPQRSARPPLVPCGEASPRRASSRRQPSARETTALALLGLVLGRVRLAAGDSLAAEIEERAPTRVDGGVGPVGYAVGAHAAGDRPPVRHHLMHKCWWAGAGQVAPPDLVVERFAGDVRKHVLAGTLGFLIPGARDTKRLRVGLREHSAAVGVGIVRHAVVAHAGRVGDGRRGAGTR